MGRGGLWAEPQCGGRIAAWGGASHRRQDGRQREDQKSKGQDLAREAGLQP